MRLIDADKLMDNLRENVLVDVTPALENVITEQPTAFDIDAFVEHLDDLQDAPVSGTDLVTLQECLKIVKSYITSN